MKIAFWFGTLAVFLNVFDMLIADIPFVYSNSTSLIFGLIAMVLGAFL